MCPTLYLHTILFAIQTLTIKEITKTRSSTPVSTPSRVGVQLLIKVNLPADNFDAVKPLSLSHLEKLEKAICLFSIEIALKRKEVEIQ